MRALGIAQLGNGDLPAAEESFRRSLRAGERLPPFTSGAHAGLGTVLVRSGRIDEAAAHVDAALRTGPPLGHYEARLARCQLAVARHDPDADALLADAVDRATRGGHLASRSRLTSLSTGL